MRCRPTNLRYSSTRQAVVTPIPRVICGCACRVRVARRLVASLLLCVRSNWSIAVPLTRPWLISTASCVGSDEGVEGDVRLLFHELLIKLTKNSHFPGDFLDQRVVCSQFRDFWKYFCNKLIFRRLPSLAIFSSFWLYRNRKDSWQKQWLFLVKVPFLCCHLSSLTKNSLENFPSKHSFLIEKQLR